MAADTDRGHLRPVDPPPSGEQAKAATSRSSRYEALRAAARVHEATGSGAWAVLETSRTFERYLNGDET